MLVGVQRMEPARTWQEKDVLAEQAGQRQRMMRAGAEEVDLNSWELLAQSQAAQAAQARGGGARGREDLSLASNKAVEGRHGSPCGWAETAQSSTSGVSHVTRRDKGLVGVVCRSGGLLVGSRQRPVTCRAGRGRGSSWDGGRIQLRGGSADVGGWAASRGRLQRLTDD